MQKTSNSISAEKRLQFNKKLAEVTLLVMNILVLLFLIYINFFSHMNDVYTSGIEVSNFILLTIVLATLLLIKYIKYIFKRIIIIGLLFYVAITGFMLGSLELLSISLIVLNAFVILTSSLKKSITIMAYSVLVLLLMPFFLHNRILTFYYDVSAYHSEYRILFIRTFEVLISLGFVSSLIFSVNRNNKNIINQLENEVEESRLLNISLIKEIAERKRVQIQAKVQATNFTTLFENSYDGFMILSSDFLIKDVNQALLDITGYEKDELIDQDHFFFLDEKSKKIVDRISPIEEGGDVYNLLIEFPDKFGQRRVTLNQRVKIQHEDDFILLVVVKDITKQTIATNELEKRERLYRTLFEKNNDSILIIDGHKIVDYNPVAKQFYSRIEKNTQENVPFVNLNTGFVEYNDSVNIPNSIIEAIEGKKPTFEAIHRYTDGSSPIYTLANIFQLKELGPNYYMIVEKDITDRKRGQNLVLNSIIQTEENERKRISSDLHDGIGPILTTIKLYAQALVDAPTIENQNVIKDKLTNIVDEAVSSISEISFNISPHILVNYGIIAAVDSFIKKFNITEKLQVVFSYKELGRFDENKEITIYRLFTELINNTLKHAFATLVQFEIKEKEENIELFYSDNGVGFNPDKIVTDSLGMGLGNLKSRVQAFDGQFILKSAEGEGMEVTIKMPKI